MSSPSPKLEFVSTVDASCRGSLRDVLLSAIPAKGGLWVPTQIPQIAPDFVERYRAASYADLAEAVVAPYFAEVLGPAVLRQLCQEAFNFPVPLVHPEGFKGTPAERIAVLELFQGPSAAFKDFAVRTLVRPCSPRLPAIRAPLSRKLAQGSPASAPWCSTRASVSVASRNHRSLAPALESSRCLSMARSMTVRRW
ncbi:MAG: hypothetical protein RJB43_1576 [Verrucomicrobiota bacterium]